MKQNTASVLKSKVDVGKRNEVIKKEAKSPSNSKMKFSEAVTIKDPNLKSSGMMPLTEKPSQLHKKEEIDKEKSEKIN